MKLNQTISFPEFSLKYCVSDTPKIGFIVSAKYGSSVERNLLKRRCRQIFKNLFVSNCINVWIVVNTRSKIVSYQALLSAFKTLSLKCDDK